MSDFMQTINRITTVANEIAAIAGQFSGQPVPTAPGASQTTIGPLPGSMAQDRVQLSTWPTTTTPAPKPASPTPAPAPGSFMQVLSGWMSRIASFFKQLFSGAATSTSSVGTPTSPVSTRPVAMADAREQLFAMMPTGQATVYGFVGVSVSRQADRILVSAGSFGSAAVIKQQGEFFYQENNKQPVRVNGVSSTVSPSGDMRFAITLDSGKKVEAEILADGRTLRFDKYTLTLR